MDSVVVAASVPLHVGYVAVFAVAALGCFASAARARLIEDRDTRRGLVALLLTSGGWALAHAAYLTVPSPTLKLAFYQMGLIVGIATVGPWLYFCSAFTGRTLHRARGLQWLAVALFLGIVTVKVTNPFHGLYYTAEVVDEPFRYVAVNNHVLHWLVMGLAYALATVGYFMLLELFWQVGHDTRPLIVLVALTGLPVVLDVVALSTAALIEITYEPLGVAVFAVGVLFLFLEDLQSIQLAGEQDDPTLVLDDANRVRDYNRRASELFPSVETGQEIEAVAPELAAYLDEEEAVIEIERAGGLRYFQLSVNTFGGSGTGAGQAITLTDITEREEYRTELERQNERLEQFASMVSHDLRNPLNVAMGRLEVAMDDVENENLAAASDALDRMETLIEDLLTLARQGQPIDRPESVSLAAIAEESWSVVDSREASLSVEGDLTFVADPDRLQQLLENLFRNAVDHGGDAVAIRIGPLPDEDGFYVADDGPGIPPEEREDVFGSGYTTAAEGTGFGLAIVTEIVEAHGWAIDVGESDSGGARFEITGLSYHA